jgi:diketogulonate reductase-like aldo/keto reductase
MDLKSAVLLNNGVPIPWVGFGVFQVTPGEATYRSVSMALKAGYRSVDTAALYQNEGDVGRAIRDSGLPREEVFVTTKVWNTDQGYDTTLRAFEESRKRLGFERVDLYLIHWPGKEKFKDTWRAMEKLVREGSVRAIGVSNFLIHHLEELLAGCEVAPAVNQVEFHPFLYQKDLLELCRRQRILPEAWSPLTRGQMLNHPEILEVARRHDRSAAQVLIRWCLQHQVRVLPRSTREEHIRENGQVFDFELTPQEMDRLDGLNQGKRIGPHPDRFF